jgi:hypothetical protein
MNMSFEMATEMLKEHLEKHSGEKELRFEGVVSTRLLEEMLKDRKEDFVRLSWMAPVPG